MSPQASSAATSEARKAIVERPRLSPNALRALGRLQEGPATGLDLFRAGAGMRYGARLLELRRAGHQIAARCIGHDPEVWLYTLLSEAKADATLASTAETPEHGA